MLYKGTLKNIAKEIKTMVCNERNLEDDSKIVNKSLTLKFEHEKNNFKNYTQIDFNIVQNTSSNNYIVQLLKNIILYIKNL